MSFGYEQEALIWFSNFDDEGYSEHLQEMFWEDFSDWFWDYFQFLLDDEELRSSDGALLILMAIESMGDKEYRQLQGSMREAPSNLDELKRDVKGAINILPRYIPEKATFHDDAWHKELVLDLDELIVTVEALRRFDDEFGYALFARDRERCAEWISNRIDPGLEWNDWTLFRGCGQDSAAILWLLDGFFMRYDGIEIIRKAVEIAKEKAN